MYYEFHDLYFAGNITGVMKLKIRSAGQAGQRR
jgi:hypothetical protein